MHTVYVFVSPGYAYYFPGKRWGQRPSPLWTKYQLHWMFQIVAPLSDCMPYANDMSNEKLWTVVNVRLIAASATLFTAFSADILHERTAQLNRE